MGNACSLPKCDKETAEIETLNAKVKQLTQERDHFQKQVKRLTAVNQTQASEHDLAMDALRRRSEKTADQFAVGMAMGAGRRRGPYPSPPTEKTSKGATQSVKFGKKKF